MLGLYAYQRPGIGWFRLIGSVLYGVAFVYFAHTTLIAHTFHGGLMVVGGTIFEIASLRAKVLWQGAVSLFIVGIILNLGVALLPLPDILQILGSSVRNLGLIVMGVSIVRKSVKFPHNLN